MSAQEESPLLHPHPPPRPHPRPLLPPPPHLALQAGWRQAHTHFKSFTGYLYFASLCPFSPPVFSFISFSLPLSVYLIYTTTASLSTIKGSSNQFGLIDPFCQPADPVYTSASGTTLCRLIDQPYCVHMNLAKALRHIHWNHNAQHNMQWAPSIDYDLFRQLMSVWNGGNGRPLLPHVSISCCEF